MARGKRRKPTKEEIDAAVARAEAAVDAVLPYEEVEEQARQPKLGRPTDYNPKSLAKVQGWAEAGLTDFEIAQNLGVHVATFYRWQGDHKEFRDALRLGKLAADRRVERSVYAAATGFARETVKMFSYEGQIISQPVVEYHAPDIGAAKLWLTNRQKKRWKDKTSQEVTGKDGGPIQTEDVTDLEKARRIAFYLREASEKIKGQRT